MCQHVIHLPKCPTFASMSKSKTKSSPPAPKGTKRPIRSAPWLRYSVITILAVACIIYLPAIICMAGIAKLAVLIVMPEGQIRSGKSGSVVWQKNNRMRVNTYPANTSTVFRQFVKSTLADFSGLWRGLTQSQQNGWIGAEGFTTKNRVGKFNATKGKDLYVKLNFNLAQIATADISDAPSPVAVPAPNFSATPTADESSAELTMTTDNDAATLGIIFEATPPLSAGSNSPGRNKYRVFKAYADSTSIAITPAALWTAYETRFGNLVAGDIIFVRASYISNVTGQQSFDSVTTKIVVAA